MSVVFIFLVCDSMGLDITGYLAVLVMSLLMISDVARCYVCLFSLYINTKIGENSC